MINDYEAIRNHPQVQYRKTFVDAVYPNGTSFTVPGNPLRMSGMEDQREYPTAPLGSSTIEIFSQVEDPAVVHEIFDPVLVQVAEATANAK